jgi:hypothetical protein
MSQGGLGEALGVNFQQVQKYETNNGFSVYPDDGACGRVLGLTERRQSAALASSHEKSCLKVAAICSSAQST